MSGPLLTPAQTAAYLTISTKTLDRSCTSRRHPIYRQGAGKEADTASIRSG
jgi:hypothetical protein